MWHNYSEDCVNNLCLQFFSYNPFTKKSRQETLNVNKVLGRRWTAFNTSYQPIDMISLQIFFSAEGKGSQDSWNFGWNTWGRYMQLYLTHLYGKIVFFSAMWTNFVLLAANYLEIMERLKVVLKQAGKKVYSVMAVMRGNCMCSGRQTDNCRVSLMLNQMQLQGANVVFT